MKRQVIYYQRLAAALILFALLFGAFGFYFGRNDGRDEVAGNAQPALSSAQKKVAEDESILAKSSNPVVKAQPTGVESRDVRTANKSNPAIRAGKSLTFGPAEVVANGRMDERPVVPAQPSYIPSDTSVTIPVQAGANPNTTSGVAQIESPVKQKEKEESIVIQGLSYPVEEVHDDKKAKSSQEQLWAALGVGAGNYNPGTVSNSNYLGTSGSLSSSLNAGNSQPAAGSAYSFGLMVGKKIGERWIVQAGASYLNHTSAYTSNINATATAGSPIALDLYNLSKVGTAYSLTSPYQVNSTLEFVSIPVQAGYLVLNRKVGVQMNAGVSSDFFLRNSLVDQSGQSGSYSQGPGSDSPYRSVNWAGLVSTEFTYRIGRQYRVAVVPGMRYLLNSPMKSGANSNAYVTDIGFRFRYILR